MRTSPSNEIGAGSAALVFTVVAVLAGGCPEPFEFAAWTIPVPEGTRIIEYAAVPREDRTERIELIEDLVIGESEGNPNSSLYRAADLGVDDSGRIFVLDAGNHRVQVFDAMGNYERTIGKEGQGPGELSLPTGLAITDGHLAVSDIVNNRLSIWTLDGVSVSDSKFTSRRMVSLIGATEDALVATYPDFTDEGTNDVMVAMSMEAVELFAYATLRASPTRAVTRESESVVPVFASVRLGGFAAAYAAAPSGSVYLTRSDEYQVLKKDPFGESLWALRVAWSRMDVTNEEIDRELERLRERIPDLVKNEFNWPLRHPALSRLSIDGHGHLYVYPFVPDRGASAEVPVDVYSPGGELLFAGMVADRSWHAANGDYVYIIDADPGSEEQQVVRYRLVEPFE